MRTLEDFAGAPQGARNMGAWAFGERFGHEAGLEEERPQLSRAIDRDRITRQLRMILRHSRRGDRIPRRACERHIPGAPSSAVGGGRHAPKLDPLFHSAIGFDLQFLQVAVSPCCIQFLPSAISADLSSDPWTPTTVADRVLVWSRMGSSCQTTRRGIFAFGLLLQETAIRYFPLKQKEEATGGQE